jgi:putative protease
MPPASRRKSEIMSPAGYWPQAQAAVEAGADSVYFGLRHFTARAKVGFSLGDVPELMRTLHRRGVRGYVTFNTLIFEHELEEAAEAIEALASAGVDALILQDYAAVELARRIAPGLELHASTQMSITNAEGVRLAQHHGNLPRLGGVRPRGAVRCLFRTVFQFRSLGRAQRQPRPVRPGLPASL